MHLLFKGDKLFGKSLDPILVEAKDKREVLPPGKKEPSELNNLPFILSDQNTERIQDSSSSLGGSMPESSVALGLPTTVQTVPESQERKPDPHDAGPSDKPPK